ncbi:TonB-dependent receptor [Catenovulum sediminis]|uniref:TonB-dependent receptor n=1 Tax=Catenovulum sediminis TaxID=1740262 RepID=A0ABV1RD56_9ALTE|nr:TonB-dependent receptor [Catenovulum sediminis]
MFKPSLVSSAIATALFAFSHNAIAQEAQETEVDNDVEVIQVSGIRASMIKAVDLKREEIQVVDSIVAEDIGKFPDNNVVEALQRVPGIQVTDRASGEVNAVSIRGLSDVTTTINGRQIFISTGRGYTLADTPAALIAGVDVYKTRSASQVETGIAGQIDVHTQRPFNFDGFKLVAAARGIYQDQAKEFDPNVSLMLSNRWQSSIGEFGALVNVAYAETNWRDMNITSGAAVPFAGPEPQSPNLQPFQRINGGWQAGLLEGLPFAEGSTLTIDGVEEEYFLARDAVFASDFTGKRERPAANISLQFRPNDQSEYLFEAFYNGYRAQSFNSLFFTFVDSNADTNFNDDFKVFEGTNIIKERTVYGAGGFNSGDAGIGKTDSYVYALGGKWEITPDFKLESEIVMQNSTFESEFFATRWNPRFENSNGDWTPGYYGVEVDFNNGNGIPSLAFLDNPATERDDSVLTNPETYTMGTAWDSGGKDEGSSVTFTLDGQVYTDFAGITEVNFGVRYDVRKADGYGRGARAECADNEDLGFYCNDINGTDPDLAYYSSDFFDDRADFPTDWVIGDGNHLFAEREFYRDAYGFNGYPEGGLKLYDGGVPTVFTLEMFHGMSAEETSASVYTEAKFLYETNIGDIDGSFGLRYSDVKTDTLFRQRCRDPQVSPTADNAMDAETIVNCEGEGLHESSKLLPSAIVRYTFLDDWLMRFAYTETIRRPDFGAFNPLRSYSPDVTNVGYGTAWQGNPDLQPVESVNMDFSLEYYFGEGNALYATIFSRDIEGLIVDTTRSISLEGAEYPFVLAQPNNAGSAKLEGVELGLVYFPENLPGVLDGFGVQASYTALESSQTNPLFNSDGTFAGYEESEMFGISPDSFSFVLAYEKDDFSSRLSYVKREAFMHRYEARLFANPLPVWRRPETSVDFQVSYDVTEALTVTFDATNLTNELYQEYYQYDDIYNFYTGNYSRTFALGLRYSL